MLVHVVDFQGFEQNVQIPESCNTIGLLTLIHTLFKYDTSHSMLYYQGRELDLGFVFPPDYFKEGNNTVVLYNATYFPEKSFPKVDNAFRFMQTRFQEFYFETNVATTGKSVRAIVGSSRHRIIEEELNSPDFHHRFIARNFLFAGNHDINNYSDDEGNGEQMYYVPYPDNPYENRAQGHLFDAIHSNYGGNYTPFISDYAYGSNLDLDDDIPINLDNNNDDNDYDNGGAPNNGGREFENPPDAFLGNGQLAEISNFHVDLADNEQEGINRLVNQGYDRRTVLQVFVACDRNFETTETCLISMG